VKDILHITEAVPATSALCAATFNPIVCRNICISVKVSKRFILNYWKEKM